MDKRGLLSLHREREGYIEEYEELFFPWAFDLEYSEWASGKYDMVDLFNRWNERFGDIYKLKIPDDIHYNRFTIRTLWEIEKLLRMEQKEKENVLDGQA